MIGKMDSRDISSQVLRKSAWGRFTVPSIPFSLLGIVFLGVLLRIYRLPEQSVWFDELFPLWHLKAPDLSTYLTLLYSIFPEHGSTPVYYVINYFWASLVGLEPLWIRCLPLAAGIATIPIVYAIGKNAFGNSKVGLTAALCLALSPQHIWHSQEIRPYSLLVLVIAISLLSLLKWNDQGSRFWCIVNIAANLLIPWIHLFAPLAFIPQGIYLLARRGITITFFWSAILLTSIFPLVINALFISYITEPNIPAGRPNILIFLISMLYDDIIYVNFDLLPSVFTAQMSTPNVLTHTLITYRFAADILMAALLSLAPVSLVIVIFAPSQAHQRFRQFFLSSKFPWKPATPLLFLMLIIIPPSVLAFLQWVTRLVFMKPMYEMYNTLGIYIGLGILAAFFSNRFYKPVILLIAACYAYQLAIFLPCHTRSDWQSAARFINQQASANDIALDTWIAGSGNRFYDWLYPLDVPVHHIKTLSAGNEKAVRFFQEHRETLSDDAQPSVWLVFETLVLNWFAPDVNVLPTITEELRQYNLTGTFTEFPGHYNVVVCRIQPIPGAQPHIPETLPSHFLFTDYDALLRTLNGGEYPEERANQMKNTLRQVVALWPPPGIFPMVNYSVEIMAAGDLKLAEKMARYVLSMRPNLALGYFNLGLILTAQQEDLRARPAFAHAFSLQPGLRRLFGAFVDAVSLHNDYDRAIQELAWMKEMHMAVFPEALEAVLRHRTALEGNGS